MWLLEDLRLHVWLTLYFYGQCCARDQACGPSIGENAPGGRVPCLFPALHQALRPALWRWGSVQLATECFSRVQTRVASRCIRSWIVLSLGRLCSWRILHISWPWLPNWKSDKEAFSSTLHARISPWKWFSGWESQVQTLQGYHLLGAYSLPVLHWSLHNP